MQSVMRFSIVVALIAVGVSMSAYFLLESDNPPAPPIKATSLDSPKIQWAPLTEHPIDDAPERTTVRVGEPTPIFTDVPDAQIDHAAMEDFISKRPIGAYRIVTVNSDALRSVIRQSEVQPTFDLVLLDAIPITLVAKEATEYSSGWQTGQATWLGAEKAHQDRT